jgi:hypothetical protein
MLKFVYQTNCNQPAILILLATGKNSNAKIKKTEKKKVMKRMNNIAIILTKLAAYLPSNVNG